MDWLDYELPPELIAQEPAERRDAARLMVIDRRSGERSHRRFADLPSLLSPGDLLVLNDTAVFPARLRGKRASGGKLEVLLLEPLGAGRWTALTRSNKRLRPGETLLLADGAIEARFIERTHDGSAIVDLGDRPDLDTIIDRAGEVPLPPYIEPGDSPEDRDRHRERYQTVYARQRGAVAAPTAGLHFTPELLAELEARGIERTALTLHVGLGTFQPIRAERPEDHAMHAERYAIPEDCIAALRRAKAEGRRIIACGTTAARTLETFAREGAAAGATALYIRPPYDFQLVDGLITNFHLPRTTLLLLVAALMGRECLIAAYEEAIARRYRFYSYGDAMLIA